MEPIIKEGVRILRPLEVKLLLEYGILKYYHQVMFKALLYTGTRYVELRRIKENPHWFNGDFIHLPKGASLKVMMRQKERWIRLNPRGKEVVACYLNLEEPLPNKVTWNENIKRWARNCHLDSEGLSGKTTRKTWESWLVFYYGEDKLLRIVQSQGHTREVSAEYYLNMPFTDFDKQNMREFVEGWI